MQYRIVVNFFSVTRQMEYAAGRVLDWHGRARCANLIEPSPLKVPKDSEVE